MMEGWGGGAPDHDPSDHARRARERTLFEVADAIEERAIHEARSLHYSVKDAPSILAAFAVADRLREMGVGR